MFESLYMNLRYDWPLHFVLLLTNWLPDNVKFIRLRGMLASPFFKKCGRKLGIGRNVAFNNPSKIIFGDYVYIAYGCWFVTGEDIVVEDEVMFGPYVIVAAANHSRLNGSWRFGVSINKNILIKKGSWIGGNSTITAGTEIGTGVVVGANTVASGTIPDHVLYAGNPGRVLKEYSDR